MKPKVYYETSFISYLTANISKNLIVAGHQQITQEWWSEWRQHYDPYVSQVVVDEVKKGNTDMASKRLQVIDHVPILELDEESLFLAKQFIAKKSIPANAIEDAYHVAIATTHGIDYLLTWNCKHIANGIIRKKIRLISTSYGYETPVICTPEELMGA